MILLSMRFSTQLANQESRRSQARSTIHSSLSVHSIHSAAWPVQLDDTDLTWRMAGFAMLAKIANKNHGLYRRTSAQLFPVAGGVKYRIDTHLSLNSQWHCLITTDPGKPLYAIHFNVWLSDSSHIKQTGMNLRGVSWLRLLTLGTSALGDNKASNSD